MILRSLILAVCLFAHFFGYMQSSSLHVLNPLEWGSDSGTIEDAQFTIQPKGIYMEVGMYLTLSAKQAVVRKPTVDANLETIINFYLPKGAIVTDSWLWIGEDIIQADIEERWAANRTYNAIVGTRKDPSLLTKNKNFENEDRYQLRVFPLEADSTRRVKVTYLVPGNWEKGKVSIPLPTDILEASKFPVENISIQCFLNADFSNPTIPQLPNHLFTPAVHETLGNHFQLPLSSQDIEYGIDVSFEISMEKGYFISNYNDEGKDYYQLVILPQDLLVAKDVPPRKIAILLDYDSSTTSISKEELFAALQKQLVKNLRPNEQFNVIFFTANGPQLINDSWLPASEQSIQTVFNFIEEAFHLSEESHIAALIKDGINFIQENGDDGQLLLVSSGLQYTHTYENIALGEELANTIMTQIADAHIPIHVADYQDIDPIFRYHSYDYDLGVNSDPYYGNGYFYNLINQISFGYTHTLIEEKELNTLFDKSLNAFSRVQANEEVKIFNQENNCFNVFTLPKAQSTTRTSTAILQVGKCIGSFPLIIEVSGRFNNQVVTNRIQITEEDIHEGTDNHIVSWTGNYIHDLEKHRSAYTLTQSIVEEVIKRSIEHRVLSIYTAFLALEANLGGYICEECVDETDLEEYKEDAPLTTTNTSNNDVDLPSLDLDVEQRSGTWTLPPGDSILTATKQILLDTIVQITASPNPFQMGTNISISFKENEKLEQASFAIYDINGRKVKRLKAMTAIENNKIQIYWDGTNDQQQRLTAGIYFFQVQTTKGRASYKLVLMSN